MKRMTTIAAALSLAALATTASAQVTKTIPGKVEIVTATVEAIERGTREVTVKKPDGTYDVFHVPEEIKRFDTLKIGDKITAKYYENLVLRLQAPGEKSVDSASGAVTKSSTGPAGTAAIQRTITATITEINAKVPSITFSGPNGWKYSSRVEDTKALAKVKVGDKVNITWTTALVVSLDDVK
jgi:hypothetical protein